MNRYKTQKLGVTHEREEVVFVFLGLGCLSQVNFPGSFNVLKMSAFVAAGWVFQVRVEVSATSSFSTPPLMGDPSLPLSSATVTIKAPNVDCKNLYCKLYLRICPRRLIMASLFLASQKPPDSFAQLCCQFMLPPTFRRDSSFSQTL